MNVNSEKPRRIRRTPEEARSEILRAAADRLASIGLEGLNISGVAQQAGMSHGTVIHHFGSTAAMRQALFEQMSGELLQDIVTALGRQQSPAEILDSLFSTLSQGGHGKLLAWIALEPQEFDLEGVRGDLFKDIVEAIAREGGSHENARQVVFLVALAAVGMSVSGRNLAELVGLSTSDQRAFPGWLAEHLESI